MINDLISKIILKDEFSQAFDDYDKRLAGADTRIQKFGAALSGIASVAGVAAGAAAGMLAAVDRLTDSAVENQKQMFNVAYAASAANREFGNSVGTVDSWTDSVQETSDLLRVFGDRDVAAATARLIDMTKRLGFTEEQMRTLLTRTGDLSAGKVDLADGVERVSAAMRGEAEASEYLGLSLNENAVRAYAEAHGLVWKNLSDVEKAQQRYALFLEQTDTMQGRAAASAETLAGQEAELERLRQRAIDQIGEGLIPLRQGEIGLWQKLGVEGGRVGDVIAAVLIGMQAQLLAVVAAAKTYYDSLIRGAGVASQAIQDIFSGADPGEALREAIRGLQTEFENIQKGFDIKTTGQQFFDELWANYEKTKQGQAALVDSTEMTIDAFNRQGDAGAEAAQKLAEETEKLKIKQLQLTSSYNQRLADLEYDHARRIVQIQQNITRVVAEAAAEAAAAREKSARNLAEGLADIERDLARDKADAEQKAAEDRDRLNQERRDAERDLGRSIRDINQDLAEDLEELHHDVEQDRVKITADFAAKRLQLEKSFADKRARLDDEYSSEYENADAFRRKILDLNRQEQLKMLDEQEAAEGAALDSQEEQAITALKERVSREEEILNREAEQKRLRQEEEYNDRIEALARERDLLEQHLAEEQARRDEDAVLAAQKLQEKHAEELARIDEQEEAKVERAQEALERENQQYQDRLASLQRHHSQQLAEIQAQLQIIENQERASYARRLAAAIEFSRALSRLPYLGGGSGGGRLGETIPGGGTQGHGSAGDTVVVNNYGASGGYAGAMQTARSVLDALKGR